MRIEWNSILSVEYLEGSGCWSSLEMATVIPYHAQRFNTIISNRINSGKVSASEIVRNCVYCNIVICRSESFSADDVSRFNGWYD